MTTNITVCPKCKTDDPKLIRRDMYGAIFGCEKCTTTEIVGEDKTQ